MLTPDVPYVIIKKHFDQKTENLADERITSFERAYCSPERQSIADLLRF